MDADRRRDQRLGAARHGARAGLALLFGSVLRTWVRDDDPGLARTMAALDRALARGQRFSGFLDDLSTSRRGFAGCGRAGAGGTTIPGGVGRGLIGLPLVVSPRHVHSQSLESL